MDPFQTVVKDVYEWSVDRIEILKYTNKGKDALALSEEFKEWIRADYDDDQEIIALENLSQ
jgi:hypothetical protein